MKQINLLLKIYKVYQSGICAKSCENMKNVTHKGNPLVNYHPG